MTNKSIARLSISLSASAFEKAHRCIVIAGIAVWSVGSLGCSPSNDLRAGSPLEQISVTDGTGGVTAGEAKDTRIGDTVSSNPIRIDPALVGDWMGRAVINEQALLKETDTLLGDARQALIQEARAFVTTEMAIRFTPSGEVETAVEIQPVGSDVIAGQTFGQWRLIQRDENSAVVEMTSLTPEGATATSQMTFALSSDGDRIVLIPSVNSALSRCEPLIYLDRQPIPTMVTAEPGMTMMR